MIPYEWQTDAVELLKQHGSVLVKAPPGSGKSLIGVIIDEEIGNTIVIAPTNNIKEQWETKYNITAMTIQSAMKKDKIIANTIILDECHHYDSPIWKQIYDKIHSNYILGLSATPGESVNHFKKNIEIKWSDISMPEIKIFYHEFMLTGNEYNEYHKITNQMKKILEDETLSEEEQKKQQLMISMKRRRLVHNSKNRIEIILKQYESIIGNHNLIICETIKQANELGKLLNVPVYHSKNVDFKALNDFKEGKVRTLVSVQMLHEGFDFPELDTVILSSSALTEVRFVQNIGRSLRKSDNKIAKIHIFIAKNTTDERLKSIAEGILTEKPTAELNEFKYRHGKDYSIDHRGFIFEKDKINNGMRIYYEKTPENIEQKVMKIKYSGGRIKIYENEILVKDNSGNIVSCGVFSELKKKIVKTIWGGF